MLYVIGYILVFFKILFIWVFYLKIGDMFVYVFVLEILIFFVLGWICSFRFVGYNFYLFDIDGGDLYWFLI